MLIVYFHATILAQNYSMRMISTNTQIFVQKKLFTFWCIKAVQVKLFRFPVYIFTIMFSSFKLFSIIMINCSKAVNFWNDMSYLLNTFK